MEENNHALTTIGPEDEAVVVSASGLRCSYGSFEAVRGIDLEVRRGEFLALLGTNGAGKTTTMETLEGHRPATSGNLWVLGGDPSRRRQLIRPRMGIMLQESGFADDLTVAETIRLWLRLSSSASTAGGFRESTISKALEAQELTNRRNTRVRQLSGGQRRRLDLILATVNRPELLFLDEPTTGLDPESRERTWSTIRDLHRDGTTVILTTHYLEEAESMADRISIMHEGRIAVTGTLSEVLSTQPARIRFKLPEGSTATELRSVLSSDSVGTNGDVCSVSSLDLQEDLRCLLIWADSRRLRLEELTATDASLAEVFKQVSTMLPGDRIEATAVTADLEGIL